jgi:hypothetical protein
VDVFFAVVEPVLAAAGAFWGSAEVVTEKDVSLAEAVDPPFGYSKHAGGLGGGEVFAVIVFQGSAGCFSEAVGLSEELATAENGI